MFNPLGGENPENKPTVDRYRNWADPVSMFDRSAVKSIKWNPFSSGSMTHDYSNLADNFTSEKQVPTSTRNPDNTVNLIG